MQGPEDRPPREPMRTGPAFPRVPSLGELPATLLGLVPALAALLLIPLPDGPWPPWLPAGLVLALSRPLTTGRGLRGPDDFIATLPFLGIGLVCAARFALLDPQAAAFLGAEILAGALVLVSASVLLSPVVPNSLVTLAGLGLVALETWAWAWASTGSGGWTGGREMLVTALETIVGLLLLRRVPRSGPR